MNIDMEHRRIEWIAAPWALVTLVRELATIENIGTPDPSGQAWVEHGTELP
jgi:hypothetical protein